MISKCSRFLALVFAIAVFAVSLMPQSALAWSCISCEFVNGVAYGFNCDDGMKHECYTEGGHQAACYYGCRSAGCGFSPDGGRCISK